MEHEDTKPIDLAIDSVDAESSIVWHNKGTYLEAGALDNVKLSITITHDPEVGYVTRVGNSIVNVYGSESEAKNAAVRTAIWRDNC